jgi:hypothetical protein
MQSASLRGVLFPMLAMLVACSAAAPPNAIAGGETHGGKPVPAGAALVQASAAKPAGKISADMVGKISPIAAFIGQGNDWTVNIDALDATQHLVTLEWTRLRRTDSGTAVYGGPLDIARGRPLALEGRLQTEHGVKALRVEIRTESCTDDQGAVRPQRIVLLIEGRTALKGCGDLAML